MGVPSEKLANAIIERDEWNVIIDDLEREEKERMLRFFQEERAKDEEQEIREAAAEREGE